MNGKYARPGAGEIIRSLVRSRERAAGGSLTPDNVGDDLRFGYLPVTVTSSGLDVDLGGGGSGTSPNGSIALVAGVPTIQVEGVYSITINVQWQGDSSGARLAVASDSFMSDPLEITGICDPSIYPLSQVLTWTRWVNGTGCTIGLYLESENTDDAIVRTQITRVG